ncbi:hypothetical protein N0V92_010419 [Colletotrichum tropicale]|nr:hypothetical protein N0V92_010419 [Colletotrichum tropicale]
MASIPYTDLDPEKRETRLLEVVCEPGNTQISYRLHTVSLDDNPYFIALSYVWGDHLVTENIDIDGLQTPVIVNLATALKHVKKHWLDIQSERNTGRDAVEFRIWADAICINQQNLPEKSEQVPLMKDIYSKADFVFAWLSSEDGDISTSLEMLETAFYLVKILVHINSGQQLVIIDDEWAETTHALNHSINWVEMASEVRISDASLWVAGVKAQKITYQYHKPLGADFWTKDLLDCFETLLARRNSTYVTGKPLVDVICCTLLQRLYSEYDLRRIASLFLYFYNWAPSGKIGEELRQAMEGLDEMEMRDNMEAMLSEWTPIMSENAGCRLVGTDDYIGIAGGDVQNDDIVCVLKDCDSPVILRPEGDHFLFVSPCFMLGLMKGEVSEMLRSQMAEVETLEIR